MLLQQRPGYYIESRRSQVLRINSVLTAPRLDPAAYYALAVEFSLLGAAVAFVPVQRNRSRLTV